MKKILTLTLVLAVVLSGFSQTNWTIDKSHSDIKFITTHMLISEVEGRFDDFSATVESSTDDFVGSKVVFSAQTASVDTDNERRDGHLKSADFFDAENHPEIKFSGTIEKEGEQLYLVGSFTMRDVTKDIKFKVRYNGSIEGSRGKMAGFKVEGEVDRFEYNLKWDRTIEAGGLVVAKKVGIVCNVKMREAKPSE